MTVIDKALSVVGLQRKGQLWHLADGRPQPVGGTGMAGPVVTPSSSMKLSAVWACANLIGGVTSSLPHELRRTSGEESRVEEGHPLHAVIYDSPNYDQTPVDFWDFMNQSIELWGNAYARIARNDAGRILALYPIQPDAMSVARAADGREILYRWSDEGRAWERGSRDVLHIRGPGGNPLGGMSTLSFGVNSMAAAMAAEQAASGMFANGMLSSVVLAFKEWMTPEQRAITDARLAEKYMGAMNAGRPFFVEGGTEVKALNINPKDAQMLEARQFSIEEICRFFQVPPVLIGHAGAATAWPTSVEQQVIMFQKFYLRRRIKRIEQAVTKQLLSAAERAQGLAMRINMEGLLRGDTASRAAWYQTMTQIGAMTINDVRRLEGMAPVAGGDVPRMQVQNVPITETEGLQ
ncbi:phage portal protein [Mangrovicoccus algicola]|uniref:Phage portal protein n=1 Tax=Mangrovicoccus algicola TaxID=2771008 RepID=A0A8J6YQ55_9RHOB|nr:phage portal protein [Mangrovicoccus algicola]MBE3637473.1 phage portal protein [Mangrovicoccus algicola]